LEARVHPIKGLPKLPAENCRIRLSAASNLGRHHVELLDIQQLSAYLCCNLFVLLGGCSEVQKCA
jgi:hypothetical protein